MKQASALLARFNRLAPAGITPKFTTVDEWQAWQQAEGRRHCEALETQNRQARSSKLLGRSGIRQLHQRCTFSNYQVSPTADKLDALGINYYTNFGTKAMLAEGWMLGQVYWADEVIGLDWLKNKIQTNTFNAFAQLKKIALSDAGVTTIKGYIDAVMRMAVKNGLVGPGTWAGDKVGQLATGDYLENGYYIYADSVSTLSADDLKNRKCPPITVCAHLAGAIHSVQITVNTER